MLLQCNATIQIQQPVEVVFDAIIQPEKITQYFIAEASGPLAEGAEPTWKFAELPIQFPITQIQIQTNQQIQFVWDPQTKVTINFTAMPDGSTLVKVNESGKPFSEENVQWALGNTEGWANFLACLKAYVEYGINLRKGAFDFMRKKA